MQQPWDSQHFLDGARKEGRPDIAIQAALAIAQTIKRRNAELPIIFTLHHLAHLCDVSAEFLQDVIFRKVDAYRTFKIRKRGPPSRQPRTICVPHPLLMQAQRWIAQNILNVTKPHDASYAFTIDRDIVKAAWKHIDAKWLVKMDLANFFESISEKQVFYVFRKLGYPTLLSFQLARLCTRLPLEMGDGLVIPNEPVNGLPYRLWPQGHLPQGAPTSPMLANLAVHVLDVKLSHLSKERGWTFTRYADDLVFSRTTNTTKATCVELLRLAEREIDSFGLSVRHSKTRISPPGSRKVVLGLLVDRERPRLTPSFRNNLETHLFALSNAKLGAGAHMKKRGFASRIGMQRHIAGLLAFAHQVDRKYAARQYLVFNAIDWKR